MKMALSFRLVQRALKISKLLDLKVTKQVSCTNFSVIKSDILCRQYSKDATESEVAENFDFTEEDLAEDLELELENKRNKSRLNPQHYNILHGRAPYDEPQAWFHHSVKYKRRLIGRYGLDACNAPPGIMWPTKEDLEDQLEYERLKNPDSLQTMVQRIAEKKAAERSAIMKRQDEISAKFSKLDQWKRELQERVDKRLREAEAARLKKERMVEEVRRHFGFKVDSRDERFKEMLEQKEKQEKKLEKEAKKKAKQEKLLQRLISKETKDDKPAETKVLPEPSSNL
ncbi:hypothetical protein B566_EDAN017682 [Ephemera danica]|nr:hypothetical protein B566_EDAN017682 [Ephemera danica]